MMRERIERQFALDRAQLRGGIANRRNRNVSWDRARCATQAMGRAGAVVRTRRPWVFASSRAELRLEPREKALGARYPVNVMR